MHAPLDHLQSCCWQRLARICTRTSSPSLSLSLSLSAPLSISQTRPSNQSNCLRAHSLRTQYNGSGPGSGSGASGGIGRGKGRARERERERGLCLRNQLISGRRTSAARSSSFAFEEAKSANSIIRAVRMSARAKRIEREKVCEN